MLGGRAAFRRFPAPGQRFALITENELYVANTRPRGKRADARRSNLEAGCAISPN